MITVIHGENIKESRNFFFNEKQRENNAVFLNGGSINITDLVQALQGKELFSDSNSIFIEELFSKRKKSKDLDLLTTFIKENSKNSNIIVWESKAITKKELGSLGSINEKKFDFPKEIFAFLDSIKPGNSKLAIYLFHKTLEAEEPEFVFFMIVRHIRILLGLNTQEEFKIDEVKRLAPWQTKKLDLIRNLFGEDGLKYFYKSLFQIEQNLKTGKLSTSLQNNIDFLLSNL